MSLIAGICCEPHCLSEAPLEIVCACAVNAARIQQPERAEMSRVRHDGAELSLSAEMFIRI